ncbi:alkene reductase [Paracoccus caeni]|uniref:Alkene reductase n=1 Tax=Paracoccus caeni TaxID=657651 RepID=A0A934VY93_9RHOB|nr:alkene reductase [Paracoccus caeni]MBK4215747.1 alkene reductase [Paracoccus caeni]
MTTLFDPLPLGPLLLKNRIVMAPLTRSRASEGRVPNAMMAEYYRQRAGAGLILTEATSVTPMGVGYADTPGIWSDEQVEGWKLVTDAVHQAGGLIALQLWHVGRISAPLFLDGALPVAPSAVQPAGHVSLVRPKQDYETPRALETDEIADVVATYRKAAENALKAGFDGIEIHAANGYLIDQFLQDSTNLRDDRYGGPIANRVRFLTEIADAVIPVWGADRVGLHLSPRGDDHDMGDSDPKALFSHVAAEMAARGIAYICIREYPAEDSVLPDIKAAFGGVVIANEGLTPQTAAKLLADGSVDAVAFGSDFIATPDLPERIKLGLPLNQIDKTTFYSGGASGYTDYPTHPATEAAE